MTAEDGTQTHSPQVKAWHIGQPSPLETFEFDECTMENNFSQEGNRVWMRHPNGWTYWDMPGQFELKKTHVDLLRLVAEILLYPWHNQARQEFEKTRSKGTIPALSFSAGTDSTAAAMIMPENTILGYHRRAVDSILDHQECWLTFLFFESKGRSIVDVASNHELLRTYHFKQIGFSTDFACASHLILLSDHYELGAIAFGMPLDNSYLKVGNFAILTNRLLPVLVATFC